MDKNLYYNEKKSQFIHNEGINELKNKKKTYLKLKFTINISDYFLIPVTNTSFCNCMVLL